MGLESRAISPPWVPAGRRDDISVHGPLRLSAPDFVNLVRVLATLVHLEQLVVCCHRAAVPVKGIPHKTEILDCQDFSLVVDLGSLK